MVWLALLTEHHASGAWTSQLLPPVMLSVCDRVGKNRAKQEMTSYCLTTAARHELSGIASQFAMQNLRFAM